jgi:hypothetical protein
MSPPMCLLKVLEIKLTNEIPTDGNELTPFDWDLAGRGLRRRAAAREKRQSTAQWRWLLIISKIEMKYYKILRNGCVIVVLRINIRGIKCYVRTTITVFYTVRMLLCLHGSSVLLYLITVILVLRIDISKTT